VNSSRESAPMLSTELLELAEEYFASSNAALSRLLGRALPWSEKTRRGGTDG
jgi:hypothetical protein